jgi:hypothetical protein
MKIFQAIEAKRILKYAFVPINVDDDQQLLHYISLLIYDYEVFDLFCQELQIFNIDLIDVAERNNYELLDKLYEVLSHDEDRLCSSKINMSDIVSEVVFTEIEPIREEESRQRHFSEIERTLDFTLFDFPNLGSGPGAPVFIVDEDFNCFGMPTKWPTNNEDRPQTPEYEYEESEDDEQPMDIQVVLKRRQLPMRDIPQVEEEEIGQYAEASTSTGITRRRVQTPSRLIGLTNFEGYSYTHYAREESGVVTRSAATSNKFRKQARPAMVRERKKTRDIAVLTEEVKIIVTINGPVFEFIKTHS